MDEYVVGQHIEVCDDIDYTIRTGATIALVETDSDIPQIKWLYLVSDNRKMNVQVDQRIGNYWRIIENVSAKIVA